MSEIVRRESTRRAAGTLARAGELRVDATRIHLAKAQLAAMQQRGEIAYAFNPRFEGGGRQREWVVNYVRLAEPRAQMPRRAVIVAGILTPVVTLAAMIYHARHVIATAAVGVAAVLALVAVLAILAKACSRSASGGHCPGPWHK